MAKAPSEAGVKGKWRTMRCQFLVKDKVGIALESLRVEHIQQQNVEMGWEYSERRSRLACG